jgi:hypothetical protein
MILSAALRASRAPDETAPVTVPVLALAFCGSTSLRLEAKNVCLV